MQTHVVEPYLAVSQAGITVRCYLPVDAGYQDPFLIRVVRGAAWNLSGPVLDVDLGNNTLTFQGSYAKITMPITHATRTSSVAEHNPMKHFIGKQVVVIHGRMKLLRGTLRSLAKGNNFHEAMSSDVASIVHPEVSESPHPTSNPPPSPPPPPQSTSIPHPNPWSLDPSIEPETFVSEEAPSTVPAYDPWRVNPDDVGENDSDIPDSSPTRFLCNSRLSSLLARCQLVLRVLPAPSGTWYQNYHDHQIHFKNKEHWPERG
ncbi:uncharacterized protein HD556DRAFT_1302625 [Suillus plorans]|uniref:Uncharacterized protein n=1 Tax=Suillus plorans TaxID=116603 RepID=A0A9P7JA19_9AGAM|nr:uncharacterized protein HD556DRAFT_1302625 [Suillus plorans]KAG1810289.1 hypothetical protein HD556DRAFT_1302625 [Suillus plorans]